MLTDEQAWTAFEARDRAYDGSFFVAVSTTRIYCKPSCPARRPRRENVRFFAGRAEASAGGYRPCLRCRPDEVRRDSQAIARAVTLIEQSEEQIALDELAGAVGYAPHHFQRLFKRAIVGVWHQVSPKHLHRYASEHEFRWNSRDAEVPQRIARCLLGAAGRLRLKDLLAK